MKVGLEKHQSSKEGFQKKSRKSKIRNHGEKTAANLHTLHFDLPTALYSIAAAPQNFAKLRGYLEYEWNPSISRSNASMGVWYRSRERAATTAWSAALVEGSWFGSRPGQLSLLYISEVNELVADFSGRDKALTFPLVGHCLSLDRPNMHSSCSHKKLNAWRNPWNLSRF